MNSDNRRRSPRVNQEKFLRVTVMDPVKAGIKKATVQLLSQDLSMHGIRFRTYDFLPLTTTIRVDLKLEHISAPVAIPGVVRRVRELPNFRMYEVGAEFHSLSPEVLALLTEFVDRHA